MCAIVLSHLLFVPCVPTAAIGLAARLVYLRRAGEKKKNKTKHNYLRQFKSSMQTPMLLCVCCCLAFVVVGLRRAAMRNGRLVYHRRAVKY